jgi:hypothetical protein
MSIELKGNLIIHNPRMKNVKIKAFIPEPSDSSETSGLTKKQFEATLERVFTTPVSPKSQESERVKKRTSESHPSDGYIDKDKNPSSLEGKED